MFKIPIKVRKSNLPTKQIAEDFRVDLRDRPLIEQKQPSNKWLFLSIFLSLVVVGLIFSWWFFSSQKIPLVDLVPENRVIFSLIDQEALYQQTSPFYQFLKEKGFYDQEAISQIGSYLSETGLDFEQDIIPLFKKQVAFILKPANADTPFPFLVIFERKQSSGKINQVLEQIEPKLKKDYNLSSQIYRQVKVTVLEPLFTPNNYFYSQIENYFIISNSQEFLEEIIDFVID
jgi:hypothetical protein